MQHDDWREYAKAVAGFFTAAVPSAIGTAAAAAALDPVWLRVLLIVAAFLMGGLSGAVTVYAIPNKPKGPSNA